MDKKDEIIQKLKDELAQYKKREKEITEALTQIDALYSKIIGRDLNARIDVSKFPTSFQKIGTNVNRIAEAVQKSEKELKNREKSLSNVISSFSSALSKASKGDLTARVDLSSVPQEYRPIGESINKIISAMEKNVDKLRKREAELRRSKEYTANLVRSAPVPTNLISLDGKRIDTNLAAERLLRRSRDEIIGTRLREFYPKEDVEKIKNALEECKKVGFSTCEVAVIRGDGTTFPAIINFLSVKDEKGNIINVLASATDITELRKREEELEKAKEFSESLFRELPFPATLSTLEGVRTNANLAFCKFFKRNKEEFIKTKMEEIYVKEGIPKLKEALEECKRTGFSRCEARMIRGDGTIVVHEISFSTLKDKSGKIMNIIACGMDITELRKREAELKKAKLFSDLIIDSLTVPIVVTDKNWKWIKVNPAFENLFGYKAEEVIGKSRRELPIWTPEEYKKAEDTVNQLIEKKGMGKPIEFKTLCKTKDGRDLDMILREVFLKEEESKEIGFIGYLFDITELRKREEELRESRQLYYELVEGVNNIVLRMDGEGTITFINRFAEELFGYTRHEIIGRDIVGTLVPEIESTGRDLKEMILDIGINPEKYKINVNENMRKNGERIWVSWTNKPVFDEQGHVVEVMCIGNDITELKKHEEKLKRLIKRYEEYIGPVAKTIAKGILEE